MVFVVVVQVLLPILPQTVIQVLLCLKGAEYKHRSSAVSNAMKPKQLVIRSPARIDIEKKWCYCFC